MPLDEVGRRYADRLYLNTLEEILQKQREEIVSIRADHEKRHMIMSGSYFSAHAKLLLEQIRLLGEARAESLLKAYEKSGLSFDDTVLADVTAEVNKFCHSEQHKAIGAIQMEMGQVFLGRPAPPEFSIAISEQIVIGVSQIMSRLARNLAIKRDELILEERKVHMAYGAGLGKEWDVFICHASEDKKEFVSVLADALAKSGLSVWYDDITLRVGDSLRRRIDDGLMHSRYGIVVLSNNFFAKNWPQQELDGLMSRQIAGNKVILPVWHNITLEEVRSKSPILSGLVAANSDEGIVVVVKKLREAMGVETLSGLDHAKQL